MKALLMKGPILASALLVVSSCGNEPAPVPKFQVDGAIDLGGKVWAVCRSRDRQYIALTVVEKGWLETRVHGKVGCVMLYSVGEKSASRIFDFHSTIPWPLALDSKMLFSFDRAREVLQASSISDQPHSAKRLGWVDYSFASDLVISTDGRFVCVAQDEATMMDCFDMSSGKRARTETAFSFGGYGSLQGDFVSDSVYVAGSGEWLDLRTHTSGKIGDHLPATPDEQNYFLQGVWCESESQFYAIVTKTGLSIRSMPRHKEMWSINISLVGVVTDVFLKSEESLMVVYRKGIIQEYGIGGLLEETDLSVLAPQVTPLLKNSLPGIPCENYFGPEGKSVITINDGLLVETQLP